MSEMVSLMVSMSSSSCSVSNRFLSIRVGIRYSLILFVLYLYSQWPFDHQCFPFYLYVQFGVDHNHTVVTSDVDLIDDCNVCDDVWPVC